MDTLRDLRVRRGLTQEALAEQLGVVRSALSQYETGKRNLSIRQARRLAEILGCTIEDVVAAAEASLRTAPSNVSYRRAKRMHTQRR